MKILTGRQIRQADRHTIENEPVDPINLMERAAEVLAQWVCNHVPQEQPLLFLVGKGNNGGDGLAMARMLFHAGFDCTVVMPLGADGLSPDCAFNLERLPDGVGVCDALPGELEENAVLIDALLGSGVDERPLPDVVVQIVDAVNALPCRVISVDMPSGMRTEFGNAGRTIVNADTTLTLEFPKLAQMLPEAGGCCGDIVVLPIGLDEEFIAGLRTPYHYITAETVALLPRTKFAHKGDFGHALLVCGSEGMTGAAILAAGGALRSGCGLVTVHVPREERFAVHASCPPAMLSLDPGDRFTRIPAEMERYTAIGVGCGMGRAPETARALAALMQAAQRPMVLDADALNLLAADPAMFADVPAGSILTPHPGELRRLVGEWRDDEHKMALAGELAARLGAFIVVKGAHTMVCTPQGGFWFNSTGTPGMAKGGCGDVLAGLLAGLLARGYAPFEAAVTGVYLHGLAGEKCAAYYGAEAMNSGDLADFLAEAMQETQV